MSNEELVIEGLRPCLYFFKCDRVDDSILKNPEEAVRMYYNSAKSHPINKKLLYPTYFLQNPEVSLGFSHCFDPDADEEEQFKIFFNVSYTFVRYFVPDVVAFCSRYAYFADGYKLRHAEAIHFVNYKESPKIWIGKQEYKPTNSNVDFFKKKVGKFEFQPKIDAVLDQWFVNMMNTAVVEGKPPRRIAKKMAAIEAQCMKSGFAIASLSQMEPFKKEFSFH